MEQVGLGFDGLPFPLRLPLPLPRDIERKNLRIFLEMPRSCFWMSDSKRFCLLVQQLLKGEREGERKGFMDGIIG